MDPQFWFAKLYLKRQFLKTTLFILLILIAPPFSLYPYKNEELCILNLEYDEIINS